MRTQAKFLHRVLTLPWPPLLQVVPAFPACIRYLVHGGHGTASVDGQEGSAKLEYTDYRNLPRYLSTLGVELVLL